MKLRDKVLIGISLVWVLFLALTYSGSHLFLIRSFLRLEQEHTYQDLSRIDQSLEQICRSLYTFTSDWSHWNDAYLYLQDKNPNFVANNITMTALANSSIHFLSYWDSQDKLKTGMAADTDSKQFVPFPSGLETYLKPGSFLLNRDNEEKDYYGYVLLDHRIMMVAAAAVTDGDKKLPPDGTMITGRFITNHTLQKLENETQLNIELFTLPEIAAQPTLAHAFTSVLASNTGHLNDPINHTTLYGYTVIRDIQQKPIGMFRLTAQRSIYLSGLEAIRYYLITFLVLGIIFSIILLILLRKLIIQRLEKLDTQIADISTHEDLSQRVTVSGNDELATVSTQINTMLGIIEASQTKLEHRVEQRTQELKETKEHVARLAHYDNLTSLPNRVQFNEMLNKAMAKAAKENKRLAIFFIDLDRFKAINDAKGHSVGDKVLKEIACRFAQSLRPNDILARLGGDEFIIMLDDVARPEQAGAIAEKLLKTSSQPVIVEGDEYYISSSIGICLFPEDGKSLEELQKNADMAMYKAKRKGGNNYQYFKKEMKLAANEHIRLEAALRKAISHNEFVMYYQPQLNLADGQIRSVEALIRWESPELGFVSPASFIPLAEETGLIMQIGEWALWEASRTAKAWQDQGYHSIVVAVNVSPKQFRHQDISQLVKRVLDETQLDPSLLEIEITETAVMDDFDNAITKLQAIRAMGVAISIDDFGTGATSINYLKQFPVQILKIDQSFIKGIPHSPNDVTITSAVITLAHNLGMKVVAEGVETIEQWQYLSDHDCDMIQGYYISRPLPEKKIILQFN